MATVLAGRFETHADAAHDIYVTATRGIKRQMDAVINEKAQMQLQLDAQKAERAQMQLQLDQMQAQLNAQNAAVSKAFAEAQKKN